VAWVEVNQDYTKRSTNQQIRGALDSLK
jgi:hypothetical protein